MLHPNLEPIQRTYMKLPMPTPTSFKVETANGQFLVLSLTTVVGMYIESSDAPIVAAHSVLTQSHSPGQIVAVTFPADVKLSEAKLKIADMESELRRHGYEFRGFCVGNPKKECIFVSVDQYSEIHTALDALFNVKHERWPFPWILSNDEVQEKRQLTYNGKDVTIRAYSDGA